MRLGLGIDTGGTYTDSVILDLDTKEIISRSKALTTHDDLLKGIVDSIDGLRSHENIQLVSLSTTLATNSVVKGKGCRVGLLTIGKRIVPDLDVSSIGFVDGEFDMRGNIVTELDEMSATNLLNDMKGKVDSIAICGYLSVRYPEHENRLKGLASEILDVPVVCAHDLTSKLGFKERLNTAVMNASLIPEIIGLISSVKDALVEFDIDAPLMIVKGDGSVMSSDVAMERPIDTIMSGPASSLTGAMNVPGVTDAMVIDIGGTTTDIGMIQNGFVHTLDEGASICGHRTRVHAADICTYGLGGDTGMELVDKRIVFSGRRSIPYCVASSRWPSIHDRIMERRMVSIDDCIFFIHSNGKGPLSLNELKGEMGLSDASLGAMESSGSLIRISLTPTDILAAEGRYDRYDSTASTVMVELIASFNSMTADELIYLAKGSVKGRLLQCIYDYTYRSDDEPMEVFGRVGQAERYKKADITTIIGVGAPSGSWLPDVVDAIGYDLIIPDDFDVRNAVGAICSRVTEYVEIIIRAAPNDFSPDPQCRVYASDDSFYFNGKDEAIEFAKSEGIRIATQKAKASGANEIEIMMKIEEHNIDDKFHGECLFRGADIIVKAFGDPSFGSK